MKLVECEGRKLTPKQISVIKALKDKILENDGEGIDNPTFRSFHLSRFKSNPGVLMLETMVGSKSFSSSDEASLRMVAIGERGGVELVNPSDEKLRGKIKDLAKVATTPVPKV